MFADEAAKGRQTLHLRCHIERCGRLIEHDDLRPADHRHRRHHALQLTARHLVPDNASRSTSGFGRSSSRNTDRGGLRLRPAHDSMADRRLAHLVHQRDRRVERGGGALGDIGELQAAQGPAAFEVHGAQVRAREQDLPADDEAVAARIAHRGEPDGRLSGRFARIGRYGWKPDLPDHRDFLYATPPATAAALPTQVDLRPQCPPVYDQGQLGSCTANAIAGAIKFDQKKQKLPEFTPSRLFVYYIERVLEGTSPSVDSGAPDSRWH